MADFTYVDRNEQLRGLVDEWKKCPVLAFDLEMEAHLHHYGLYLSLVQISDGTNVWLVDMLAITDPERLVALLENPAVCKVFHDVSFDFRVLDELYGCHPKNIIDTKIAALLLGKESISLSSLLKEYFGVIKNEKFQRVDWMLRPLKHDMLAYAAGDVKLLLQLKDKLLLGLEEKGRLAWCTEECAFLEDQSYAVKQRTFQDVKGSRAITDEERGVLAAFYEVREGLAEKVDRPIFFVIPDKLLLALAKRPPRSVAEWKGVRGVHPIVKKNAFAFVKALQGAKPIPKEVRKRKKLSFKDQDAVDALLKKRDVAFASLGIEPYLVLTRDQAEKIILGEENVLRSWQKSLLMEKKLL